MVLMHTIGARFVGWVLEPTLYCTYVYHQRPAPASNHLQMCSTAAGNPRPASTIRARVGASMSRNR